MKRRHQVSNKSTRLPCIGCGRMAGEPRLIEGTALDLCAECNDDQWDRARALNKVRGEVLGIQRSGS